MGGYTYAANNPATNSDPTGLKIALTGSSCSSTDQACNQSAQYPCQTVGVGCTPGPTAGQILSGLGDAAVGVQNTLLSTVSFGVRMAQLQSGNVAAALRPNPVDNFQATLTKDEGANTSSAPYAIGELLGNIPLLAIGGPEADTARLGLDIAAEDTGLARAAATCGGMSFSARTKVLLASGAAAPISQLQVGGKVLATNVKTGKTRAETVTAVLSHRDTDLYDLKIRAGTKTAVIDTTSNHLFWVPGAGGHAGQWAKAGSLRRGTRLRTPTGGTATVLGGRTPKVASGWMWDLTVPGGNDHDFYIDTIAAPVLVHNSGCDEWAANFAAKNGGEIKPFKSPARYLGPYRPDGPGTPAVPEDWGHHTVVVQDGQVFDQWHATGVSIEEFKQMFDYSDFIAFGF
jgi:hypothetical protein